MIKTENVSFAYGRTDVLDDVSIVARDGDMVGLIGPNGSGKTTLLQTLYAARTPRVGTVLLDDEPVHSLRPMPLARKISVVPQESDPQLPVTVAEMVLLGRSPLRSMYQSYSRHDHQQAAAALQRVNLRHLAGRPFTALSGGEKQRVLIARSLAQEAEHLLLDEPTNHLDIRYQHDILDLVRSLEITTVVVLHDLNLAARYCNRLVLLDHGRIVASGTPDELLRPEVLEPVYHVAVQRIDFAGCLQLLFRPGSAAGCGPGGPSVDLDQKR